MTFYDLITSTVAVIATSAAIYTVEPAVSAATHRLLVINQITDQSHLEAATAICQQLDNQAAGNCAHLPAGYLDHKKKQAALEEAALLAQPVPVEPTTPN